MDIKLKKFQSSMTEEIVQLIITSILESHKDFYPKVEIKHICSEYTKEELLKKNQDREMIVLHEDEIIIGVGSIKENSIKGIYIAPRRFQKGYGQLILDYLEEFARNSKVNEVSLYASLNALGFYKKNNYEEVREICDDNGKAVFMTKKL